jgi:hypothetical protein
MKLHCEPHKSISLYKLFVPFFAARQPTFNTHAEKYCSNTLIVCVLSIFPLYERYINSYYNQPQARAIYTYMYHITYLLNAKFS